MGKYFTMQSGKVKFYNSEKAYGFITNDNGGKDIFFHVSQVEGKKELRKGESVTFDSREGKKGLEAVDVRPV